jgi:hypothetical protein
MSNLLINSFTIFVRNKLKKLQQPTGLRFDGEGFAKVNRPSSRYVNRFNIRLNFKTSAQEGIIFLAGKKKKFMSIELRDGRILYQVTSSSFICFLINLSIDFILRTHMQNFRMLKRYMRYPRSPNIGHVS